MINLIPQERQEASLQHWKTWTCERKTTQFEIGISLTGLAPATQVYASHAEGYETIIINLIPQQRQAQPQLQHSKGQLSAASFASETTEACCGMWHAGRYATLVCVIKCWHIADVLAWDARRPR